MNEATKPLAIHDSMTAPIECSTGIKKNGAATRDKIDSMTSGERTNTGHLDRSDDASK